MMERAGVEPLAAGEGDSVDAVPAPPTHFLFEHRVFQTPDARFLISVNGIPSMAIRLGDIDALLSIASLYREFVVKGSADDAMLEKILPALKYVKVIRPGDSIPREILDGSASWSVQDHHFELARARLSIQILSWLRGQEVVVGDRDSLLQMARDDKVKNRVNQAFADIAVSLGYGAEQRQMVIDLIDRISRELAYIEALRERSGALSELYDKVVALNKLYARDRTIGEEIGRICSLMRRPIQDVIGILDQVDAQTGEIIPLLRNYKTQTNFIRGCRDDLHMMLMRWDETIATWKKIIPERSSENEVELKTLYRFIARHFIVMKEWQLSTSNQRKS